MQLLLSTNLKLTTDGSWKFQLDGNLNPLFFGYRLSINKMKLLISSSVPWCNYDYIFNWVKNRPKANISKEFIELEAVLAWIQSTYLLQVFLILSSNNMKVCLYFSHIDAAADFDFKTRTVVCKKKVKYIDPTWFKTYFSAGSYIWLRTIVDNNCKMKSTGLSPCTI